MEGMYKQSSNAVGSITAASSDKQSSSSMRQSINHLYENLEALSSYAFALEELVDNITGSDISSPKPDESLDVGPSMKSTIECLNTALERTNRRFVNAIDVLAREMQ